MKSTALSQEINGKMLYYGFLAGSKKVLENQVELNRINVFPVRDKDTGTNLASTIRSVIDTIKPHKSFKTTIENIANAALVGARGNSGVIFAQFLYGLSNETKNKHVISLAEFAESVKKSIPYIYDAIANPVEGTMITVIRDWSDFLNKHKESIKGFKKVIIESLSVLEKSLNETTTKLKGLSKYGFVDAGAKGFVVFIQGFIDFIKNRNIRDINFETSNEITLVHSDVIDGEVIKYRYCTEAIIKNLELDTKSLKKYLKSHGDSVVVAGSEKTCRIHLHTNTPANLFVELKNKGLVTYQKVDDMVRQQEMAIKRKWNIALVTDSTCDLPKKLLDFYQINMLPINLNFGDNHFLDKVTIQPEHFYNLLDSEKEFPKTSQINEHAFTNLYSHLASHYDAIISIHLTSKFSGTHSNAVKAAKRIEKEFNKPVHVFDSKNLSGALGLVVLKAAQNIEKGDNFENIINSLQKDISLAKIFVSVKDLKYMIRGGRVSRPAGFIANILGLNPVISMDEDGNSLLFGKTFSQQSSLKKVLKHIEKIGKGRDMWNYMVLHAHNFKGASELENKMEALTHKKPISVVNISPVIGMHAGNGTVAVAILFNN